MSMLAKWLKRASSLFTEKPNVKVDDFGMEHFLVYHGLVGSSPENQREFKDVRADISSAVTRGNSQNLCINLKLAPLWWEDKLQRIFKELIDKPDTRERALATLLPEKSDDYEVQDYDPLRHQDWRVRANAALALANLKVDRAEDDIIRALRATADSTTPAFCHISRALAAYRTDKAKAALADFLDNEEPWIKVDVVSALSRWPLEGVGELLSQAFSRHHDFIDYSAVALAKHHQPLEFLQLSSDSDRKVVDLGAALIVGLLDASKQTFSGAPEILTEARIHQCLEPLSNSLKNDPTPLKMRALVSLAHWLDENYSLLKSELSDYPGRDQIEIALALSHDADLRQRVVAEIERIALTLKSKESFALSELRHGLKLVGEIRLTETINILQSILETPQAVPYRNEIIEALGELKDAAAAPQLVKFARQLVKVDERSQPVLSSTSVLETDPENSKTYWYILKSLGNLPSTESLALILEATGDYAADKREEALSSAINLRVAGGSALDSKGLVKEAISRSLNDPSAQVRLQALKGVSQLKLKEEIEAVTKMINAQEISVARASFDTLEALAAAGNKKAVKESLLEAKRNLSSTAKIKRIDEFISHHC